MTIKLIIFGVFAILSLGADSALKADASKDSKQVAVPLKNFKNFRYYTTINVGTPPKSFQVIFSSMFSFFWLPALNNSINTNKTYIPSESSTSKCYNKPWSLTGLLVPPVGRTENTSGVMTCMDTVRIGGLTLYKQTFGVAKIIDKRRGEDDIVLDGMLGLGFQSDDIFHADTTLTTIDKQKPVSKSIFSVWLNINYLNPNQGGEITFGGYNPALFTGSLSYVPLATPHKSWQIKIESASMGSTVLDTNFNTYVDMTEGCINVPKRVLSKISTVINLDLNSTHFLPCNTTSLLPPITFTIKTSNYARQNFSVDYKHYFQPDHADICYVCFETFSTDEWTLGDPFVSQFYTVFDAEYQRLGLAKAIAV